MSVPNPKDVALDLSQSTFVVTSEDAVESLKRQQLEFRNETLELFRTLKTDFNDSISRLKEDLVTQANAQCSKPASVSPVGVGGEENPIDAPEGVRANKRKRDEKQASRDSSSEARSKKRAKSREKTPENEFVLSSAADDSDSSSDESGGETDALQGLVQHNYAASEEDREGDPFLTQINELCEIKKGTPLGNDKLLEGLAKTWKNEIGKEKFQAIQDRQLCPDNAPFLVTQKLNPSIFDFLTKDQQQRDKATQRRQKALTQAAIPLTRALDSLMSLKPGQILPGEVLSQLKQDSIDSFSFLSAANTQEVIGRRYYVQRCIGSKTTKLKMSEKDRSGDMLFSEEDEKVLRAQPKPRDQRAGSSGSRQEADRSGSDKYEHYGSDKYSRNYTYPKNERAAPKPKASSGYRPRNQRGGPSKGRRGRN